LLWQQAHAPPLPLVMQQIASPYPDGFDEERLIIAGQQICYMVLLFSCFAAMMLIVSEALQGIQRSIYCRLTPPHTTAPATCTYPLMFAACLCHAAVVTGLACVARFAWRSLFPSSWSIGLEHERSALKMDLRKWRRWSVKIIFFAGAMYLLAGTPCAGQAKPAFMFLATAFLMLYAVVLFLDDDFENARMSPRCLRILGVYLLVGVTFIMLNAGVMEWFDGHPPHNMQALVTDTSGVAQNRSATGPGRRNLQLAPYNVVCNSSSWRDLSPRTCTVPLDLSAGLSFWWAGSPLFSVLLSTHGEYDPRSGVRRILQQWRRCLDLSLFGGASLLLVALRQPCRDEAPIAFGNAELGVWIVGVLMLLRSAMPATCDGWRGPLEHLNRPPGPTFSMAQCAICLADLQGSEDVCRTQCGHDLHRDCLEEWVLSRRFRNAGCPLCRKPINMPNGRGPADCIDNGQS